MRNLKKTLVLLTATLALLLSSVAYAQDASSTEEAAAAEGEAVAVSLLGDSVQTAEEGSQETMASIVNTAYGVTASTSLQSQVSRVDQQYNSLHNFSGDPNQFATEVRSAVGTCTNLANGAARCCGSPDMCSSSSMGSFMKKANPWIQKIGLVTALFGGEGGAASCLTALPTVSSALAQSKGIGKGCATLNSGGMVGQVKVIGAIQFCTAVKDIVSRAPADEQSNFNSAFKNGTVSQLNQFINSAEPQIAQSAEDANKQAASMTGAIGGIAQCVAALSPEDIPDATPTCNGSATFNASKGGCVDSAGESVAGGDDLFKAGGSGDLGPSTGLASEDVDEGLIGNTGAGLIDPQDSAKTAAQGMPGARAGGLAGAGNSSGAKAKGKARGRRSSASRNLISGYKTSKGGGSSSSSNARKPTSFRGLKSFSKASLRTTDKAALAALSKLVKAGISPDQSGSIFERVSKRFTASTAKENLFDAKRNKRLWMEK